MNEQNVGVIAGLFPEVGEPTIGGLIVGEIETAFFLLRHAEHMQVAPCIYAPDCEMCNADNAVWWEWCLSLSGPVRIRMQRVMRESGIALPPSPWEEVSTSVVPTALD